MSQFKVMKIKTVMMEQKTESVPEIQFPYKKISNLQSHWKI